MCNAPIFVQDSARDANRLLASFELSHIILDDDDDERIRLLHFKGMINSNAPDRERNETMMFCVDHRSRVLPIDSKMGTTIDRL
jgi:hypothetical protein